MHPNYMRIVILGLALAAFSFGGFGDASAQTVFERVFGISKTLDADMVAKVKALPAGERLPVDRDGDGTPDELWYLDTTKRHTKQPLLVRAVDEDKDLAETGRPDLDSDAYFYDWGADGAIDVVTDYQDNDGDDDVDEMGIFYDKSWKDDKDDITVWWGVDVGDDNLLWYDVDGTYYQDLCQYRTHFSGDEMFYQFRLAEGFDAWLNVFEDPFAFYDADGDTCSEVVVRVCALGHAVENLRYSIDADGDAFGTRTHDYEFSVTALPGDSAMSTEGVAVAPMQVRGIPTHPVLSWADTRAYAKTAPWAKAMLTWDELNANTEGEVDKDSHERWEGLINRASRRGDFPQVGGPPTSAFNKRVEVSEHPASPLRLYFDTADQRLHLLGARYAYLDVDYNLDGTLDARYEYEDTDADGVLDRRRIDLDGDGTVEFDWAMNGIGREIDLEYEPVSAVYTQVLSEVLANSQRFIDTAKGLLEDSADPVETFFLNELPAWHAERELGLRIRTTPGGARYYMDLVRDRLFHRLSEKFGDNPAWTKVEQAYSSGDVTAAADALAKMKPGGETPVAAAPFGSFTKRVGIRVDNSGHKPREHWPVVLPVAEIRKIAPDFNPRNCAVTLDERWLDWYELPHQIDTLDENVGEELSFSADLGANATEEFYIAYSPEGTRETSFPRLTSAVLDTPAYVAWESDAGAYRFYTGQFDYFGKQSDRGLPRAERLLYPIVEVNYHAEQDWGIDALHVDETSGLGGLTLHLGDASYLVQSPAGKGDVVFKHRVLFSGPVRSAVEITAENVVPGNAAVGARFLCIIYAGRRESEIRAQITGVNEPVDISAGLLKLVSETSFSDAGTGVLGTWGFQEEGIGEIGLSVMVPPSVAKEVVELDHERRIRCSAQDASLRYWILGDWRRGMQYPVAPTVDNWRRETNELARQLTQAPAVTPVPTDS
ncbi:MAG: DUF4861 family protein [Candidatus Hydrogenedentes bacterium]|nr:DUF4861 family protein [Candidatus Hydrogenedentota bacterium]